MRKPTAKHSDLVQGTDVHIVMVPSPERPAAHAVAAPAQRADEDALSPDVRIECEFAATVGSVATDRPPHVPTPTGTAFQIPATDKGTIRTGSAKVRINRKAAARDGDPVDTCNDVPPRAPAVVAVARSTVRIV